MTDKKISRSSVILTLIVLVCLIVIGFQAVKIKRLENNRFTFAPGESLPNLELLSLDNTPFKAADLAQGVTLLYCFKIPCSACNSNLNSWNNIANFFGDRIKAVGIIPDGDPAALQLVEEKKISFPLYVPVDKMMLKKKMRLKMNTAQTIIVHNNKVMMIKLGDLSLDDLNDLVLTIKKIISS